MQIKTTMRYYYTSLRRAKTKKISEYTKHWWGYWIIPIIADKTYSDLMLSAKADSCLINF